MSQVISFFSRLNDDIEIGCMDASTSNVFSFDLRLSTPDGKHKTFTIYYNDIDIRDGESVAIDVLCEFYKR